MRNKNNDVLVLGQQEATKAFDTMYRIIDGRAGEAFGGIFTRLIWLGTPYSSGEKETVRKNVFINGPRIRLVTNPHVQVDAVHNEYFKCMANLWDAFISSPARYQGIDGYIKQETDERLPISLVVATVNQEVYSPTITYYFQRTRTKPAFAVTLHGDGHVQASEIPALESTELGKLFMAIDDETGRPVEGLGQRILADSFEEKLVRID